MTVDQLIEVVNSPTGIAVLAIAAIWCIAKEVFVAGKTHREAVQRERARGDEWKELATGITTIADKAVTKLEKDSE